MLPELFCEKMKTLLGEEYEAFLGALDRPRAVGLRLNPLKLRHAQQSEGSGFPDKGERIAAASVRTGLAMTGRDYSGQSEESAILNSQLSIFNLTPVPWCPTGFYYDPETRPGLHPLHAAGAYYLQEPSAMAPVELLDPRPGERVLDLCAAPGGKSTQIAGKLAGRGLLVCNELQPKRAAVLASNIERLGVANALVLNEHPARLAERFPAYFDRVLVDAPCSGEGMFRKHDAASQDWSPETVAMCARRQAEILDCAAAMLKPGGRLVYSTCTFSPEENEGSIEAFLQRNPDFCVIETEAPCFAPGRPDWAGGDPTLARCFRLWPHRLLGEGHFAAVLQKGIRDQGSGIRDQGSGIRDQGSGIRDQGSGLSACSGEHCSPLQLRPDEGSGIRERGAERNGKLERGSRFRHSERREESVLPKPVQALLAELGVSLPEGKPVLFGDRVFWAPPETPELEGLKVLRPGLELAELRRDLAVPAHALALWAKTAASVHALRADEPACAAWLRGETIPTEAEGWTLVTVDGLSLGWGKGVRGTLKNHYPKALRMSG